VTQKFITAMSKTTSFIRASFNEGMEESKLQGNVCADWGLESEQAGGGSGEAAGVQLFEGRRGVVEALRRALRGSEGRDARE
jgi:hypothetical protein